MGDQEAAEIVVRSGSFGAELGRWPAYTSLTDVLKDCLALVPVSVPVLRQATEAQPTGGPVSRDPLKAGAYFYYASGETCSYST